MHLDCQLKVGGVARDGSVRVADAQDVEHFVATSKAFFKANEKSIEANNPDDIRRVKSVLIFAKHFRTYQATPGLLVGGLFVNGYVGAIGLIAIDPAAETLEEEPAVAIGYVGKRLDTFFDDIEVLGPLMDWVDLVSKRTDAGGMQIIPEAFAVHEKRYASYGFKTIKADEETSLLYMQKEPPLTP